MTPSDIDAVIAIEKGSFAYPWRRPSFEYELQCRQTIDYVVLPADGDEVVAYICLRRMPDGWHLLKIAVAPALRRRGIATWLLTECFGQARFEGTERMVLELRPSNFPAKALYERLGFRKIGIRQKYYPETGEDALIFVKDLKEAL
jgi:ribosomal-protein-alanine N-acetyltransferase